MIDRTTKAILAVIALGLAANAVMPMLRPTTVAAQSSFNCTGELAPNSSESDGAGPKVITGWSISVRCK